VLDTNRTEKECEEVGVSVMWLGIAGGRKSLRWVR
jgi:hypothetical protein